MEFLALKKSSKFAQEGLSILLFESFGVLWVLEQTIWRSNLKSHTKVYFNEIVANALRDNIGMIIFDLRGYGGCKRPKTYLNAHFGTLTQCLVHPTVHCSASSAY